MTKSYNYIPTHFLYSSLLFFLLIFMYQQIHCHTLPFHFPKFFSSEFMYQPYTAPTLTPTRPASGLHTSPRPSSHTNQSTNDTVQHTPTLHKYHNHTASAPIQPHKPIHQRHRPTHNHTPQIPQPYSLHTHTASTKTHNHTPQIPHTQTHARTTRPRPTDADADAVAPTLSHSQPRCTRSHAPVRNSTGQAPDRIRLNQTRQDQAIQNQTGQDQAIQNQTGQDQAAHSQLNRPGIRQAIYRIRPDQIRPSQTRPNRIRPYQTKP